MSEANESGTKTVRISSDAALKLQTISSLKEQMGTKFRTVEFLNGLVEGPIAELYEATLAEFDDFRGKRKRKN